MRDEDSILTQIYHGDATGFYSPFGNPPFRKRFEAHVPGVSYLDSADLGEWEDNKREFFHVEPEGLTLLSYVWYAAGSRTRKLDVIGNPKNVDAFEERFLVTVAEWEADLRRQTSDQDEGSD